MSIERVGDVIASGGRPAVLDRVRRGAPALGDASPIPTIRGEVVSWSVDPLRVLWVLLAIVASLVMLGSILPAPFNALWLGHESWTADQVGLRFDLDGEGNVPAFFSAMQLLACAIVLAVIATRSWSVRNRWRFHWTALAAGFAYLALDEAAQLHELLALPGDWIAGATGGEGGRHGAWILAALVLVVPLGLAFVPFLLALPPKIATLMCLSGAVFLGGAVGMEALQAAVTSGDPRDLAYASLMVIEEAMEMVGIALFFFTLLRVLALQVDGERFTVDIVIRR